MSLIKNGCKEIAHHAGQGRSPSWRSGATTSRARRATSTLRCGTPTGARRCSSIPRRRTACPTLMRHYLAGPARPRARDHLFPRAVHQFLQALPGRHVRADARGVERRQSHRGLPAVRRGNEGDPRRMPHRRRRPQSLSRLRRADRGGPRRASSRSSSCEPPYRRRRLSRRTICARSRRRCARRPNRCAARKCCARRFGDAVVDHYVHAAEWEQGEYDRRITDWELKRGFERS